MANLDPDLICSQCPLADCSEESLWCAFRWATDPNKAQLKALEHNTTGILKRQFAIADLAKKTIAKEMRRQYLADYYQDNKDRKLAAANARNAVKRAERNSPTA